ncbi:MAG TPA: amidohydrolase family protein [Chthoniobacterales bacterium]|nr:amidohydrolase family protein [Chthoniobacterales bacterium]
MNPIDLHVHVLGNGLAGSGCRIKRVWWQEPFVRTMSRSIGLTAHPGSVELDAAYVQQLRLWLDDSSLAAVVLLACDDVHQEDGVPRPDLSRIYVPNEYVLELARQEPRFLPGISIHPARRDAIELLEAGVAAGAVLLKLLPCVQIVDPGLARYRFFWKRMAELQLPLLAHTGGEFSLPTYRPDLCNPACLRPILEQGVKVIAAHCGAPALPWQRDFSPEFLELRNAFSNLYGDISALSLPVHFKTISRVRENPERILHGSDYPVVTSVLWSHLARWISADEAKRLWKIRNPLQRKLELTQVLGFPDATFAGVYDVLRQTPAVANVRAGAGAPSSCVNGSSSAV